jgi:hypothetical protein
MSQARASSTIGTINKTAAAACSSTSSAETEQDKLVCPKDLTTVTPHPRFGASSTSAASANQGRQGQRIGNRTKVKVVKNARRRPSR